MRNGRMTQAQSDAIDRLSSTYVLPYQTSLIDLAAAFDNQAPVCLEIGFGNGDALLEMAQNEPDMNFLGVEVHSPGIGHALLGIESKSLSNVRLIQHDAIEVLENMLGEAMLARVLLFFPDPWHKKRHHKRRIVQQDFQDAVARTLISNGILHCATDWADYATWMLERLESDERFVNQAGPGAASPRPEWRPVTRFERRGTRLGHEVADLIYTRENRMSAAKE